MPSILVIDDDDLVLRTVQRALKLYGHHVMVASGGAEGMQLARRHKPDLMLLDVVMPGLNGYQVCRQARSDPMLEDVPILFLTARGKDEDKIEGFRAGADDYLTKPFNMEELRLRIAAILRRHEAPLQPEDADEIKVGEVNLNCRTFEVRTPVGNASLTNVQFDLLYHLMINSGQTFTSQQLLQDVRDYPPDTGSPELVRAHIKNLREKIEPVPNRPVYIRTLQGHGYTFTA